MVVAEQQKVPTDFYGLLRYADLVVLGGYSVFKRHRAIPIIRPSRSVVVNCVKTSTPDITVARQTSRSESNHKLFTV